MFFIKKIRRIKILKHYNTIKTIDENTFILHLVESCFKMQDDKTFFKGSNKIDYDLENKRNRMVRSLLDVKGKEFNYVIKDQTQRGESQNGIGPGEIDFLVEQNCNNFTIIEALNMDDSFDKTKLSSHEEKLKNCYDKLGNRFDVLLVYADTNNYEEFSKKYCKYINEKYGKNQVFYDTEKVNSFGFKIEMKHFFKVQHIYHLIFKIG